jgi:hypothetical protein
MSHYNLKYLKQEHNGTRFETLEETDMGNRFTDENIERATSKETLRFFRKAFDSKQKVTTEIKDGLEVVKIFSYEPHRTDKRTVHVYTEIAE